LFFGAGTEVIGGERVEAAGRDAQLVGGLGGRQRALQERVEHIADEGGCVTRDELLMLFKDEQATRRPCPHPVFSSGIAPLALLQDGLRTRRFLFC
jgi:hypothetical protein